MGRSFGAQADEVLDEEPTTAGSGNVIPQPGDFLAGLDVRTVLDHVDAPISITKFQGAEGRAELVYVNPAVTRLTGYQSKELIGRGPEVWHGSDMDVADLMRMAQTLRGGHSLRIERTLTRRDGNDVRVEVSLVPVVSRGMRYTVETAREMPLHGEGRGRRELLSFSDLSLDVQLHEARRGDRVISLTPTEAMLLETFLRYPGELLTRGFLFGRVWGFDPGPRSKTVEVYVGYLRNKTEAAGEPRLLHTIRGEGYVLRES